MNIHLNARRSLTAQRTSTYIPGLPYCIFSNQKIPIWVNFEGTWNGRCWYIFRPFGIFNGKVGIFYGTLVYFMAILYILWSSDIFSPVLVCCSKKNLATLLHTYVRIHFRVLMYFRRSDSIRSVGPIRFNLCDEMTDNRQWPPLYLALGLTVQSL
jgi:hypothetical protein